MIQMAIHQGVNQKREEVPDPEGGRQEGTQNAKSGSELPEDLQRLLREVIRRYPELFKDIPEGCSS